MESSETYRWVCRYCGNGYSNDIKPSFRHEWGICPGCADCTDEPDVGKHDVRPEHHPNNPRKR